MRGLAGFRRTQGNDLALPLRVGVFAVVTSCDAAGSPSLRSSFDVRTVIESKMPESFPAWNGKLPDG